MEGIDATVAAQARESLGAAFSIADQLALPALADNAGVAFTESLQIAGLAGGAIMLSVAAVVFLLTPKGINVTQASHG